MMYGSCDMVHDGQTDGQTKKWHLEVKLKNSPKNSEGTLKWLGKMASTLGCD